MAHAPSPRTLTVAAHAKVNLVLRILAREASGYHGLETLFQRLALHDAVTVTVDVPTRTVTVLGSASDADIRAAIDEAGSEVADASGPSAP
jgi:4-diphosphocytidyl-2-C-methyl-D-erythritol kinase